MAEPKTDKDYYARFLAELEEILRHKYLRSEQEGHDIGFERALTEWHERHRAAWVQEHAAKEAA
jgi:hypothetical protein